MIRPKTATGVQHVQTRRARDEPSPGLGRSDEVCQAPGCGDGQAAPQGSRHAGGFCCSASPCAELGEDGHEPPTTEDGHEPPTTEDGQHHPTAACLLSPPAALTEERKAQRHQQETC